jgi:hypothetical protein
MAMAMTLAARYRDRLLAAHAAQEAAAAAG